MCHTRTCKKCNITKDIKSFNFHSPIGYYSKSCKDCENTKRRKDREHLLFDFTKVKENRRKVCVICKIEKSLEEYKKQGGRNANACKECAQKQLESQKLKKDDVIYPSTVTLEDTKICPKCKQELNLIDGFYYSEANKRFSGHCRSCNISRLKDIDPNKYKLANKEHTRPQRVYNSYKIFDANKGLEFDLTLDYIKESLQKACVYCGFSSTGLDRKNNSLGHTIKNTVSCCKECNSARMNHFSHKEMLKIGEAIREVKIERTQNKLLEAVKSLI